jgi:hypothetical protein
LIHAVCGMRLCEQEASAAFNAGRWGDAIEGWEAVLEKARYFPLLCVKMHQVRCVGCWGGMAYCSVVRWIEPVVTVGGN